MSDAYALHDSSSFSSISHDSSGLCTICSGSDSFRVFLWSSSSSISTNKLWSSTSTSKTSSCSLNFWNSSAVAFYCFLIGGGDTDSSSAIWSASGTFIWISANSSSSGDSLFSLGGLQSSSITLNDYNDLKLLLWLCLSFHLYFLGIGSRAFSLGRYCFILSW